MKLVIVESPLKAKRLAAFLGAGWHVEVCRRHIRDLPPEALGVEIHHDFRPIYQPVKGQAAQLRRLQKSVEKTDAVYIATAPDREGEAQAWHLIEALKPAQPVYRVRFDVMTEAAVREALDQPHDLDLNQVEAWQTRRILDRLTGYCLTSLVSRVLHGDFPVTAAFAAALRFIIAQEREIERFNGEPHWTLTLKLAAKQGTVEAKLCRMKGYMQPFYNRQHLDKLVGLLKAAQFRVSVVGQSEIIQHPRAALTLQTLQPIAAERWKLSPERTQRLLWLLYETGWICHPASSVLAPTDSNRKPEDGNGMSAKLYRLIWQRFMAAPLPAARYAVRNALIAVVKNQPLPVDFCVQEQRLIAEGYLQVDPELREPDIDLPSLNEGDVLQLVDWHIEKHVPAVPVRYTAATLPEAVDVRALIQGGYIELREDTLHATEKGWQLHDFLINRATDLFSWEQLAVRSNAIEQVAAGEATRLGVLRDFWTVLQPLLAKALPAKLPRQPLIFHPGGTHG